MGIGIPGVNMIAVGIRPAVLALQYDKCYLRAAPVMNHSTIS